MGMNKVKKQYTYFLRNSHNYIKKTLEYNFETNQEEVWEIVYNQTCTVRVQAYENITMGQAKRILRNHRMGWHPRRCGMGGRKLKDKMYISGGCNINYDNRTRRLTIRVPFNKIKILSKEIFVKKEKVSLW
ncbi:hypothetical protein COPG_00013 [Colwellia phage 9A]|uniref:Uncharacterized protein n=1 Tax=Colwellia phage 9A TaxID=765765 RepID=I3UM94_9CAUD|nr:hypothetical protein COPG_00013 [Colwellia phage 9A]AFK66609.1 hypothetical protein COPG_00013 [Colwellia phage 9A]